MLKDVISSSVFFNMFCKLHAFSVWSIINAVNSLLRDIMSYGELRKQNDFSQSHVICLQYFKQKWMVRITNKVA